MEFSIIGLGTVMIIRAGYSVASDVTAQVIEGQELDITRTVRYTGVGTLYLCPVSYGQWVIINGLVPGTSLGAAVIKTAVDLFVVRPTNGLTAMALTEGIRSASLQTVLKKIKRDFMHSQLSTTSFRVGTNLAAFLLFSSVPGQMIFLTAAHFAANVYANHLINLPVETVEEDEDEQPVLLLQEQPHFVGSHSQSHRKQTDALTVRSQSMSDHVTLSKCVGVSFVRNSRESHLIAEPQWLPSWSSSILNSVWR